MLIVCRLGWCLIIRLRRVVIVRRILVLLMVIRRWRGVCLWLSWGRLRLCGLMVRLWLSVLGAVGCGLNRLLRIWFMCLLPLTSLISFL